MSGLIYYIRGTTVKPSANDLLECGLLGEVINLGTPCMKFVDGSNGYMFTLHGRASNDFNINFNNEIQNWTDIPGTKLSIGYYLNNPPKPSDFLRKDYLDGHKVLLGDGNEWVVPLARRLSEGCILPKEWSMFREGEIVNNIIEKYAEIQKIAEKIAVICGCIDDKEKDLDFINTDSKLFMVCANILKVNYNIGFREISILKLFNSKNTIEIPRAVVDMPYIDACLKELESNEEKKKSLGMTGG